MYVQQTWPPHSKQSCIGVCELTNTQTHSIIQPRTSGHHVHTAANVLTVFRPYLMYACGYVSKHMYADMNYTKVRVAVFMKWGATFIRKHTPHSTTYTTRAHTVRTYAPTHALQLPPHTHEPHTHTYTHSMHAHDTMLTHNHTPQIPNIHHKINLHQTIHIWTPN